MFRSQKINLKSFVVLLLVVCSISTSKSQDKESFNTMTGIADAQHYDLKIKLDPPGDEIRAQLKLSLKLLKSTKVIRLNFEDLTVDSVFSNAGAVSFVQDSHSISVQFKSKLKKNKTLDITVNYHGIPKDGLIIRTKNNGYTAFADNWASRARNWFPSIDHPSDKASFQSSVEVPVGFEVIGNGKKISDHLNGHWHTITHRIDQPIATYCMVIGISRFAISSTSTKGGIPLFYYTYPADSLVASLNYARAADMVHFYDSLIGPYPFPQLALVQSSTRFGGMENSSAIFFADQGGVFRIKNDPEGIIAHEIAHQWFGDAVTESTWSELWLSEGFATYFSALYFEARDGKAKFESILNETRSQYQKQSSKNVPVIYNGYPRLMQLLNAENYQKGGLFLHALRQKTGDDAFFNAIRTYYMRFKNKNATTADFRSILESSSQMPLGEYFSKWLDNPGLPSD